METRKSETLDVRTSAEVVGVRHLVRKHAVDLGFTLVEQTKIVTAASELARNMIDYGKGGNPKGDPSNGLRDYLVQVDAANPDLFLGKAYYALGPLRVHSNFFILERHRRGLTNYARR